MSVRVFKYELPVSDTFDLTLPPARLLHVGFQGRPPCLWAMVDSASEVRRVRKFRLAGTGHPLTHDPKRLMFIGTCSTIAFGGDFVLHLFEIDAVDAADKRGLT